MGLRRGLIKGKNRWRRQFFLSPCSYLHYRGSLAERDTFLQEVGGAAVGRARPRMLWDVDSASDQLGLQRGGHGKKSKRSGDSIENRDHRVMRRVNSWSAPRWIRYWMLTATRMGDGWLWYSLGALLVAFGGPRGYEAVGAAGTAAIVGIFVFKALKKLSHRPRPCQFQPHCWSKVLPPDHFPFPWDTP